MPTIPQTIPLSERIAAKRAGRLATTPTSLRGHFEASWAKTASPRRAIKAQCLECVGFERKAITECTSFACSLYEYRPYQPGETPEQETATDTEPATGE